MFGFPFRLKAVKQQYKEMILRLLFLIQCELSTYSWRHLGKQVSVNLLTAEFSVSASQKMGTGHTKTSTFPEFLFAKYSSLLRLKPNKGDHSPSLTWATNTL